MKECLLKKYLKIKRLGAKGFARFWLILLLESSLEVRIRCLSCYPSRSIICGIFGCISSAILILEVRSEVATSDLEY